MNNTTLFEIGERFENLSSYIDDLALRKLPLLGNLRELSTLQEVHHDVNVRL